jgi:6-pyruvoyl-tetrahydropterin synthase
MSTISVKTHFAAGHRILGLSGEGAKCRNIHGHTFHVTWTFAQDQNKMTVEFGAAKVWLKQLIKAYFDHAFIVDIHDEFCHYLDTNHLKHYQLECPPTTEAIVAEIAGLTREKYPTLIRVELNEGPENTATWEPSGPTLQELSEYLPADLREKFLAGVQG